MQRLALFDLDNTLVDRDDAFRRWAAEFVEAHGLPAGALEWMIEADDGGFGPRDRFFADARQLFDLEPSADELWARYRSRMPELVRCFPGTHDALRALRDAGWLIGIVTNGRADNQVGKIRRAGLADLVDAWAVSGELGIRKPDIRIFEAGATGCGVALADGGWMVGDNPAADIDGGRGAGLRTIWIHRGQRWPAESGAPDHTVDDITDALALLLG